MGQGAKKREGRNKSGEGFSKDIGLTFQIPGRGRKHGSPDLFS